jgi:hypothetical protein
MGWARTSASTSSPGAASARPINPTVSAAIRTTANKRKLTRCARGALDRSSRTCRLSEMPSADPALAGRM